MQSPNAIPSSGDSSLSTKSCRAMNALSNAHAIPGEHCPNRTDTSSSASPELNCLQRGVSVEYALDESKQWYVLRVTYGRVIPAKLFLEEKGVTYYIPYHRTMKLVAGKRTWVLEPLLSNLLFVYASKEEIDMAVSTSQEKVHLSYYYNHFVTNEFGKNPPLTIDYATMLNFICVTSVDNRHIRVVQPQNCHYKSGDTVKIVDGEFKGVEGKVARVAGQQRVVVELADLCMVATAYIPTAFIELKEETNSNTTNETTT